MFYVYNLKLVDVLTSLHCEILQFCLGLQNTYQNTFNYFTSTVLKKIEETKPETMLITCRSIRIGSYRQPSSVEENFEVSISKLGFVFNIRYPHLRECNVQFLFFTKLNN